MKGATRGICLGENRTIQLKHCERGPSGGKLSIIAIVGFLNNILMTYSTTSRGIGLGGYIQYIKSVSA